jgi:hypothetical protein
MIGRHSWVYSAFNYIISAIIISFYCSKLKLFHIYKEFICNCFIIILSYANKFKMFQNFQNLITNRNSLCNNEEEWICKIFNAVDHLDNDIPFAFQNTNNQARHKTTILYCTYWHTRWLLNITFVRRYENVCHIPQDLATRQCLCYWYYFLTVFHFMSSVIADSSGRLDKCDLQPAPCFLSVGARVRYQVMWAFY